MSIPDNELHLDKLFLPAWAQEPASANLYAKYEGEDGPRDRERGRDRRGPRPPARGGPPGDRGRGDRGPRRDGQGRRPEQRGGGPGAPGGAGTGAPGGDRGRGPRQDRGRGGPRGRFNQDRE